MSIKYAWYSKKHHKLISRMNLGYDCYVYLNSNNKEIICTMVSNEYKKPIWNDIIYVGEVINWVRNDTQYVKLYEL